MTNRRRALTTALALAALPVTAVRAQPSAAEKSADRTEPLPLFALELRTGANWDHAKPAQEQAHFREHSAHLRRLREQQSLVLGARVADRGFIVLAANSEQDARGMIDQDPSIQNRIFAYDLHPFAVFYPGCVQMRPRRTS